MKDSKAPLALVVDDDSMQRLIVSTVLEKFGVESICVSTSREFIQKIKVCQPDLCLIDLNIESLGTGFTIIKAVRNVLGSEPNLIVVSQTSDRNAIAHAMELGANDFILKPMDREVFISKISYFITTPQLLDARSMLLPVPNGGAPATLDLEFEVQSVDEFGVKLIGKHLISKGAVVRMEGPFVQALTGQAQPSRFTITSTWVESDGSYGALAELDHSNDELITSVRKWLANERPSQ